MSAYQDKQQLLRDWRDYRNLTGPAITFDQWLALGRPKGTMEPPPGMRVGLLTPDLPADLLDTPAYRLEDAPESPQDAPGMTSPKRRAFAADGEV